ncbi:MAG: SRPBCC family protein [Rhizobiales bacterium]|nr:SRPBCC family protein [Hyphomicrobiales bacterium]
MPYTVKMHRVLKSPPERVFKSFLNPQALVKWIAPAGYTCTVHHVEPKVGGTFRMSFTEFDSGSSHAFGGEYLEIVPNEKLRYTDKFEDPNLAGNIEVTVTMKPVMGGTDLRVVQEGIPDIIPEEMCYLGWQDSMKQLAQFVELPPQSVTSA